MGAAELVRFLASAATWASSWISDGDLQDARARAWAEVALDERDRHRPRPSAGVRSRCSPSGTSRSGRPVGNRPRISIRGRLRRRAARDRHDRARGRWSGSAAIFGLRLGLERPQRQSRDPRRGLGAVQLRRLSEPAGVARVPVGHRDDGQAPAGPRAVGGRRRASATTARRSRSSCCRTSRTGASTRWRACTSSRRPRLRSTS